MIYDMPNLFFMNIFLISEKKMSNSTTFNKGKSTKVQYKKSKRSNEFFIFISNRSKRKIKVLL